MKSVNFIFFNQCNDGMPNKTTNTSSGSIQKHKIACINCSKSHHKCDKIYPSCSYCLKRNIPCEVKQTKKRGRPFGSKNKKKRNLSEDRSEEIDTTQIMDHKKYRPIKPSNERVEEKSKIIIHTVQRVKLEDGHQYIPEQERHWEANMSRLEDSLFDDINPNPDFRTPNDTNLENLDFEEFNNFLDGNLF